MTMGDMKCDVCNVGKAIGVASTLLPYSCAYCKECAQRNAQPELVFTCLYDDVGSDVSKLADGMADTLVTFSAGKYMSYQEWAAEYCNSGRAVL